MSGGDDPFGRQGEERTDAFGRPIADEAPAPSQRGFAPPTDAPAPDTSQWWTEAQAGTIEGRAHGAGSVGGHAPAEYVERLGAAALDFLIRMGIILGAVIVGAVAYLGGDQAGEIGVGLGFGLGVVAAYFVYAPYMIAKRNGQTLGHKAVGIRTTNRQGGPIGGGKAFVREALVKGILIEGIGLTFTFGIALLVNYLWPLWDDKNEALHDKMCDTRMFKV